MNRRLVTILAAGAAGAFAIALPLNALPKGVRDTYNTSNDTVFDCGSGNKLTFHAPSDLWPPNHKYYTDITVTATDAQGQTIELESDGTHNGYDGDTGTEANGSGNTADDIRSDDADAVSTDESTAQRPVVAESGTGTVVTDWDARAERAGTIKEGRDYTLHAVGTFSDGSCEGSVIMHVPHDMRRSNR